MAQITRLQKSVAAGFCKYLYDVPTGERFTLRELQGALRFVNREIPAQQDYALHLRVATEAGWIEPVPNDLNVYKRIGPAKSSNTRYQLTTVLKEKIICAIEGRDYLE